ncbi:hypothetical protein AZE42_07887 [Rhizopogon vesiculosus]|uniref:Uncharacterized protein n=1 Tax=Rhizopogon vesiculosus TaxID=180088 RepID=A0A1J8PRS7_9AGAM|nr:hypothetical protein AZE42_07887 [Rhizopogon vesiculosus]
MKSLSSLVLIALISPQLRAAKSLSVLNVTSPSAATRRPVKPERVPRLPQGFFDDARDGVQSSTIPVTRVHASAPRRRSFMPSLALQPHALLSQLSSLFRNSQPNTGEVTALQQLPRQNVSSCHRPPVVDVAPCQDRQPVYVARRPSNKVKKIQQQQGLSQDQAQASTSQTQTAAISTSITPPQVTTAGAATTQSQPATTSKNPTLWARFVFFICCASIDDYR